jgi:hypothetical protein
MSMMSGAKHGVRNAAGHIKPTAGRARGMAEVRILGARGWTAPQFHRAAHFVDVSMAPRISAMLTGTARRIEPTPPRHRVRTVALSTLGMLALLAAIAAATAHRRNQMAELLEPDDSVPYEERTRSEFSDFGESDPISERGRSGIGSGSETDRFGSGSWVGRGSGPGHNRGVGRS